MEIEVSYCGYVINYDRDGNKVLWKYWGKSNEFFKFGRFGSGYILEGGNSIFKEWKGIDWIEFFKDKICFIYFFIFNVKCLLNC